MLLRTIEAPQEEDYEITTSGITIGRNNIHRIQVNDDTSSRNHAKIFFQEDKFFIKDVGSLQGTYIKI
jgi:pSer/pThr/pTyr-binding forkhead associated (FHA) protein